MLKFKLIIIVGALLLPTMSLAQNTPCSGKGGGIAHCDGSKFVCNNGSYSKSKKDCPTVFGNESAIPNTAPTDIGTVPNLPNTGYERTGDILKLDYEGFTVWLDCSKRGAVKFRYNAQHDTGNQARAKDFMLDPNVPVECQQTSAKSYGQGYDRGHQVPANHLDASPVAIKQSNYMTNILPQVAQMNRGAWLLTEEIVECYRDIDELLVIGGVIWGNNPSDDYFILSHGVKTPDAFWKVVIRGKGDAIAWIVPNSKEATKTKLDNYIVTVEEIEKRTGEQLPVTGDARITKPNVSWQVPIGCNKS